MSKGLQHVLSPWRRGMLYDFVTVLHFVKGEEFGEVGDGREMLREGVRIRCLDFLP